MTTIDTSLRHRSSIEDLYKQSLYFTGQWPLQYFSDSVSEIVTVLNKNRQIVFCNQALVSFLDVHNANDIIGKRPGEAFRCAHAGESNGGCGTTEFCKMCGAFRAIMQSQKGNANVQECRIIRDSDSSALDLQVRATPLSVHDEPFTIFAVTDISHEKRRKALESIFFHDVLNLIGGLVGYSELLQDANQEEAKEFGSVIHQLSLELTDQIEAQRELSQIEHNEYTVRIEGVHSMSLLTTLLATYKRHMVAQNKTIVIGAESEDFICATDERLLKRIVGNLIKNALEAVPEQSTVTIGCRRREDEVQFWVHNPSVIPYEVQLQMFQRSFSTKGTGRGLGTYSVKLFTERFLQGRVSFVSNQDDGTRFTITVPTTIFGNDEEKEHLKEPVRVSAS
ncbi:MAG: HAMP domain-containing histidine kinase [Ignavibacteriales bacterium]|nr:HAMP domain-containing histidine kinase [Ignavibacteriales bacterium]